MPDLVPTPPALPVPPGLEERFVIFERLLQKWQPKMNLVSPKTMKSIRTRHIEDSLQVTDLLPGARQWIDLGSGGGFPGIVTALRLCFLPEYSEKRAVVHLIESDHRKCAFLREVSRETLAPVQVHRGRIEEVLPNLPPCDAISSRALASLASLYKMTADRLEKGEVGVFLKGQDIAAELTGISISSNFSLRLVASRTDREARIVVIGRAESQLLGGVGQ